MTALNSAQIRNRSDKITEGGEGDAVKELRRFLSVLQSRNNIPVRGTCTAAR